MTAEDNRFEALQLAVQLHSSSNVTRNAVPPKAETVVTTAHVFNEWLASGNRVSSDGRNMVSTR